MKKRGAGLKRRRGFSLMEVMIALAIIVTMATVLIGNFSSQFRKSQVSQAKILLAQVVQSLETFYRDCSFYPTADEGLLALAEKLDRCPSWGPEPYFKKGKIPKDPWKRDLIYEYDEESGSFEVLSLGKDGREGGEDYDSDLSSDDI